MPGIRYVLAKRKTLASSSPVPQGRRRWGTLLATVLLGASLAVASSPSQPPRAAARSPQPPYEPAYLRWLRRWQGEFAAAMERLSLLDDVGRHRLASTCLCLGGAPGVA